MSDYFIPSETCPNSKELLLYGTVSTVWCGPCGLLNPQFAEPAPKLPERTRSKPAANQEVIEIEESPVTATKSVSSASRFGLANQKSATMIPTVHQFKVYFIHAKLSDIEMFLVTER